VLDNGDMQMNDNEVVSVVCTADVRKVKDALHNILNILNSAI